MNRGSITFEKRTAWVVTCLLCILGSTACCVAAPESRTKSKPKPEVFDQEVVTITVDYDAKQKISVEPESARIYFQWSSERSRTDHRLPVQARWVVRGLKGDHEVHIVSKEKDPKVRFPFPDEHGGRPAYEVPGRYNSIASGTVHELPGLVEGKGYTDRRLQASAEKGEPYEVVWKYDVIVTDSSGEELFRIDPQIVVAGHP